MQYLTKQQIDVVVDATHPFATQMSHHAAEACGQLRVPLAVLSRPAWVPQQGDRWIRVASMEAAVDALGLPPRTVFLTVGGLQLAAFAQAPQHRYIVRTIDAPEAIGALPRHRLILARGPFGIDDEIALMRAEGVAMVVTKNSGGAATRAKLAAARTLGIDVVMVERPAAGQVPAFFEIPAVLAWIEAHRLAP
jgi:precorrin-6A/cobalt-precorrin-6A reductase